MRRVGIVAEWAAACRIRHDAAARLQLVAARPYGHERNYPMTTSTAPTVRTLSINSNPTTTSTSSPTIILPVPSSHYRNHGNNNNNNNNNNHQPLMVPKSKPATADAPMGPTAKQLVDKEEMLVFGIERDAEIERLLPRLKKVVKKKKNKKGKQQEEKIIPRPLTLEEAREQMDRRFEAIEKEHRGHKRGVATVKFLVGKKGEKLHKTVTTKLANTILNDWIYTRHALKHGFLHLNEMTKTQLAESLIRPGTTIKFDDRDARMCLKEMFRHGKSSMLESYHKRDIRRDVKKIVGSVERNNAARRSALLNAGYSEDQLDEAEKAALSNLEHRSRYPGPIETLAVVVSDDDESETDDDDDTTLRNSESRTEAVPSEGTG